MQSQLPAAARQAQNKHRTATTIPQCTARSSRFIFFSLPEVTQPFLWFGPISQVFCSFWTELQQLLASLFLLDLTSVCFCPGLTVANLRVLLLILSSTILLQSLELSLPGSSWIQGFWAPECLVFPWDLG